MGIPSLPFRKLGFVVTSQLGMSAPEPKGIGVLGFQLAVRMSASAYEAPPGL